MRVLITGAGGFIGGYLIRALQTQHEIVAAVRRPRSLRRQFPDVETVSVDFAAPHTVDDWLPILNDVDAVINAVGIFRERGRNTFEQLHQQAACVLFQACRAAQVRRVVQISALGADEQAVSRFHLSKLAADNCLRGLDLDWIILQPSLVYGPGGRSAEFFRALAALPVLPLVSGGEQRVQPIYAGDLAAAVSALLHTDDFPSVAVPRSPPSRVTLPAVGPRPLSVRDMLAAYRDWLGMDLPRTVAIPYPLAVRLAPLGRLFGAGATSGEALAMLERGNTGDAAALPAATGIRPRSLGAFLREHPAQQADRWHARLFFLRPALRISLGLLWLFSGSVSLGIYPVAQSYALLAQVGITGEAAPVALYSAALIDIVLGIATLLRKRIRLVGTLQIVLMIAYSLLISVGPAELWLHPFGPVTKNVPLIVATLMMIALERD